MIVTFYNNAFSTEFIDVDVNSILKQIKQGKWKDKVKSIRAGTGDKKKMPAFTSSGTFPEKRKAKELGSHSGLIAMDFDNVPLDVREELYADEYTYSGFVSVGGAGICLIVKIDPKKHIDAFRSLERYYFSKYGLQVDQSCKDVSRLRFVSYDPDLYLNQDSKKFTSYLPKPKGRKPRIVPVSSTDDDVEHVVRQIEANRIDLTSDYSQWVEIGMSIHDQYGNSPTGLEYFQRVSQFYNGYDPAKTEKKYCSFGKSKSGITIATLMHYAKNAGCEIKTQTTRQIETVAKWAKKGRRNAEDAIKQLEKLDNIPPEKSKPVVDAIFSGKVEPDKDDDSDVIFQIEQFLTREVSITFNEVTLKYELDGVAMTDRDFNSIYLDCKKMIPKTNKDLFLSCVDSDRTKIVNPIKDFFKNNQHKKQTGLIKKLTDCIKTPTGYSQENYFPEYAYYFTRKWMIGAVAMWHKYHSPLMLVLTGSIQNTGKTHFFRYIFPNELQPYFGESELTGDKDENLLMCTKAALLNDEMSNKSKRDITVLKKLCSAQWFNIRKPYGKLSEDFRRIATLCGTSNSMEILSDPTGNRRIIPIEVTAINHDQYNSIDKTDLWLEAYHAWQAGEAWHLSNEDIKILSNSTTDFNEASLEAELVSKYFKPGGSTSMTNSEIKSYIEVRTHQRLNQRKLGMELKRMGYEKKNERRDNAIVQVYVVTCIGESKSAYVPDNSKHDLPF